MRILICGIVNQEPKLLDAHLHTILQAAEAAPADCEFAHIVDPEAPGENADQLPGTVIEGVEKPEESSYEKTEQTTRWDGETFRWMAHERQRLLDLAADQGFDLVWMLDTDLLVGPETLTSLLNAQKPIVSGVFWTRWQKNSPPLPQVWLQHPYELRGRGWDEWEFLEALAGRQLIEVGGLGACTLMRTDVLDSVAYWPPIEGLPEGGMWQGEDRAFSIRAERNHVPLHADGWPDIYHVYRPSDREQVEDALEWLARPSKVGAEIGDLVNVTIEPLEEERLAGHVEHVRGALGAIGLLSDLRQQVLDLPVGESAICRARFPPWTKLADYRNREKTFRVTLVDAKANFPPIGTGDHPWTRSTSFYSPSRIEQMKRTTP